MLPSNTKHAFLSFATQASSKLLLANFCRYPARLCYCCYTCICQLRARSAQSSDWRSRRRSLKLQKATLPKSLAIIRTSSIVYSQYSQGQGGNTQSSRRRWKSKAMTSSTGQAQKHGESSSTVVQGSKKYKHTNTRRMSQQRKWKNRN
uniref:Uncharacterized protein n=1 Tax=Ditylenchus dipsaci TaxID=166011 RepID=A0A915CS48_9BILA